MAGATAVATARARQAPAAYQGVATCCEGPTRATSSLPTWHLRGLSPHATRCPPLLMRMHACMQDLMEQHDDDGGAALAARGPEQTHGSWLPQKGPLVLRGGKQDAEWHRASRSYRDSEC